MTVTERPDTKRPKGLSRRAPAPPKGVTLGVEVSTVDASIARGLRLRRAEGVYIAGVKRGGLADGALRFGDVILQVGSTRIKDPDQFARVLASHPRGKTLRMRVWRSSRELFVAVKPK